jgi:hypothetical protein
MLFSAPRILLVLFHNILAPVGGLEAPSVLFFGPLFFF